MGSRSRRSAISIPFSGWLRCAAMFLVTAGFLALASPRLPAQARTQPPLQTAGQTSAQATNQRWSSPSDLGRENLNHVAASAEQLEEVLRGDSGLMVEMKRWIAKQATDTGQVVTDAEMSDDAVYERLRMDIEFRSVATRLVQRYGYLVPQVNPLSAQGKEEGLLIKEQTEWLTQLQGEELASQREIEEQRMKRLELTGQLCDPANFINDPECPTLGGYPSQRNGIPGQTNGPQGTPSMPPGYPGKSADSESRRSIGTGQSRFR